MDGHEIGVRDRVLSSTEKNEPTGCVRECPKGCTDAECETALCLLNKSYESWHTLGTTAFSALSVGTCIFSVLTINGFISLLSSYPPQSQIVLQKALDTWWKQ